MAPSRLARAAGKAVIAAVELLHRAAHFLAQTPPGRVLKANHLFQYVVGVVWSMTLVFFQVRGARVLRGGGERGPACRVQRISARPAAALQQPASTRGLHPARSHRGHVRALQPAHARTDQIYPPHGTTRTPACTHAACRSWACCTCRRSMS